MTTPALKALDELAQAAFNALERIETGNYGSLTLPHLLKAIRAELERCAALSSKDAPMTATTEALRARVTAAYDRAAAAWMDQAEGKEYPVRAFIIDELCAALSAPAQPVRWAISWKDSGKEQPLEGDFRTKDDADHYVKMTSSDIAEITDVTVVPLYLAPPPDPWRAVAEGLAKHLDKFMALNSDGFPALPELGNWDEGQRALAAFAAAKEADKP